MEDLVTRFRDGDPDALRAVYRRYAGAVATVARSVVGTDDALCADIVQQSFVKAWRAAATLDTEAELSPWLYTIARRTAIDAIRHERRPTLGGHEPEADVAVTALSFERIWETYEVRRALDGLPPDEREVLRLSHLMGYSHREIADRLSIPIGTVKSRSHRAHRKLVQALTHLLPDAAPSSRTPAPSAAPGDDR